MRLYLGEQYENDIKGHGAIDRYYGLKGRGTHKECMDFSTPDNFPPQIAAAISKGLFCGIGISEQLLTVAALAEYKKVTVAALAEYNKVTAPALAEYKKVTVAAFWRLFANKKNRIQTWRKI